MKRLFAASAALLLSLLVLSPSDGVNAIGLNTGMHYRYPWTSGVTMTRTQGWGDADPSHTGNLYYAVDWDNGSGNWLVRAANGGTIRCDPVGGINPGIGNYVAIYNNVTNQTSIYGHLQSCGFFAAGMTYAGTQGQGIGVADCTGTACDGLHLHFQAQSGDTWNAEPLVSVAFAMSDKDDFDTQYATDGPSDNVPVAVDANDVNDASIRLTYLAQGGANPASASWWNVGAPYQAINNQQDEFGGPCRNLISAYVHLCPSNFSPGVMASQNYIDWKGVRHSIYHTSVGGQQVKGQIQGALSNNYGSQSGPAVPLARTMGAPTIPEGSGIQSFQGGYLIRANGAGIKIEAWVGGNLIAVLRYDAYGVFCPSINGDRVVNSGDFGLWASWLVNPPFYNIQGDLNANGTLSSADQGLMAARFGIPECVVSDP